MPSHTEIDSKDFWEEQGRKYGSDSKAVNFDPIGEELPARLIDEVVGDGLAVCDFGCGNGRSLLRLAESRPNGRFHGLDFSESMIEAAERSRHEGNLENLEFGVFDVTKDELPKDLLGTFDIVMTKRLIVNVRGQDKRLAVERIHALLKPGGTYLMMECFEKPLQRVNEVRALIDLEEIPVNPFNEYIPEGFMDQISDLFSIERKVDYESLYYFISRIFNAYLSDGKPSYDAPINQLAGTLLALGINPIEGFSPEVGYLLKST